MVLYRKYGGSTWVDPHEEEKVAFKDLPNRFPSVLSRDFRKEAGAVRGLRQPLRDVPVLQPREARRSAWTAPRRRLEIARTKVPLAYPEAARLAARSARSDSENYGRKAGFRPEGTRIGEAAEDDGGSGAGGR